MGVAATANAEITTNIPTARGGNRSIQLRKNLPTSTPAIQSLNLAIFTQVNQYRQSHNLPALIFDPAISAQAQAHSDVMAKSGKLSHDHFNERVDSISAQVSYKSAAENVASNRGYARPDTIAVKGWIDSPGHHHNLIGRYDRTGIGVAKNPKGEYFFTQIFVRKPH